MRVIRLYDPEQCGADNPFFVTRVVVPNRRLFEFLERLDLGELSPFPKATSTVTIAGLDPIQLQEVFNIVGLQDTMNLFVSDNVAVFELFSTQRTNVASVRLDDGVFITESFQLSRNIGYTLPLFGEIVNLAESFAYNLSLTKGQNLSDVVAVTESFSIGQGTLRSLFFLDSIGISDSLNFRDTRNTSNGFTESLSVGELWELFRFRISSLCTNYQQALEDIGGEVYNLQQLCQNLNAFNANVRPPQESLNAFQDFLALIEVFTIDRSRSFGNELESMVSVAELFAFRANTIRTVNNLIDQVGLNEDFSLFGSAENYQVLVSDVTSIQEEFSFSRSIEALRTLQDVLNVSEEYTVRRNQGSTLFAADLVSITEQFTTALQTTRQIGNLTDFINVGDLFATFVVKMSRLAAQESVTIAEVFQTSKGFGSLLATLQDEVNVSEGFFNTRTSERNVNAQDGVALAEIFNFGGSQSYTRILTDQLVTQDAFGLIGTKNVANGFTESLTLGETWNLFTFGQSALCAEYQQALEEIGGQVYNYSALCQNLNALNPNVRPPQSVRQSYQEVLELNDFLTLDRTAQFTRELGDRLDLGDLLSFVKTRNLTNNQLDQLTLSEIFTILSQTDKVYNLFFEDALSVLETRDYRDRNFTITDNFVDEVRSGEDFAFNRTSHYSFAFTENVIVDTDTAFRGNQGFNLYFQERLDLLGIDDFIDVRKPSARLLTFVDGVNLIEGNT